MIYTVTFNPSLDYSITIPEYEAGSLNRSTAEQLRAGGKGVNVSLALTDMGVPNTALGFIAGFTGEAIESMMRGKGCSTDFIRVASGFSRINVKMFSESKTRLNGMGPKIPERQQEELLNRLSRIVKDGDTLVLAGNVPTSMPQDTYEQILNRIDTAKVNVIINVSGNLMRRTLAYHPFLVKPDLSELREMFDSPLITEEEIIGCAKHLQEEGARNVLIALGIDGAILVTENDQIFSLPASGAEMGTAIGADDFMIAGFIAGYQERESMVDGFRKGVQCSAVTNEKLKQAAQDQVAVFVNEA